MDNNKPQQQEQPVGAIYTEDARIILTGEEFDLLTKPLRAFEMALAIANMKRDQLFANKQLLPVYLSDLDKNGKLKDEKAFFEKFKPKEQPVETNN